MSVIYIVLPLALLLAAVALYAFIRSVRAGQFDDVDTPAVRLLLDDDEPTPARPRPRGADPDTARLAEGTAESDCPGGSPGAPPGQASDR